MKKICQICVIFLVLFPAVLQANATDADDLEVDYSYKKVDFEIKEVVVYPHNIVLFRKEATVTSGSKFYTEFEGDSFPGCVRIIEEGSTVKDITIKNDFNYKMISTSGSNTFSISKLLKDNVGKTIELITSDAFYSGKLFWIQNSFVFLRNVHLIKMLGEVSQERNVSFLCLKTSDIENIVLMEEPDLPEMEEEGNSELVSTNNKKPKTRITWEDTGGSSRKVTLIYIISGISWKSEYFLDTYTPFEDETEDNSHLEHWASITNNLNIDLVDINLRLVAGDIQLQNSGSNIDSEFYRMNSAQFYLDAYSDIGGRSSGSASPSSFTMQEFIVFTIPYKVTLKKGETKQIQIQTCNVEIVEEFVYDATHLTPRRNSYSTWNGEESGKVKKILKIKNNGKTWPEGIVNVYEDYMLIGQDGIQWTPKGREAKVTIGIASDIEVKKKATVKKLNPENKYDDDYDYTITIEIKNFKDKQVTVKVFDTFLSDALDLTSKPDFEEKPGNQMSWEITLKSGEEKNIVYTFETRD